MKEELTKKMHSELNVTDKTDIKHRVFALLSEANRRNIEPESLLSIYGLSKEEVDQYSPEFQRLNK